MENVEISFVGATPADASRLADDLAAYVRMHIDGAEVRVIGGSSDAMDFGATVALVLGTPAVIILARGIADWVRRQGDPDLLIKTAKGSVTVKGGLDMAAKKEIILAAFEKGAL
ncbi:MAG: hypothetical protein KIT82_18670 [Bradyrhizobium sp.]|nr:hypothetical protein [Bradyrhizobium sp.]